MNAMDASISISNIKTRFLVLSDTHGKDEAISERFSEHQADVAIHCGDLTTESKIQEFKAAIRLLQGINAPLKLVLAGNHDFTMDIPVFQRKVAEVTPPLDPQLVKWEYGDNGEAGELFYQMQQSGIILLEEGIHHFSLDNGALLKVYASPYTPSVGDWGFQYHPDTGHNFHLDGVDVVITHGPPKGVMDSTHSGGRAGCPKLFEAVARARPRMHCFGHIHEGWGAKLVTWREKVSESPSHFTDIDNGRSTLIGKLSHLNQPLGTARSLKTFVTSHCQGDPNPLNIGFQTLFVNAAIEGNEEFPTQPPWLIELELPSAPQPSGSSCDFGLRRNI